MTIAWFADLDSDQLYSYSQMFSEMFDVGKIGSNGLDAHDLFKE